MEKTFIFDSYSVNFPAKLLTFVYKIEGEGISHTFSEKLHLPKIIDNTIPENLLLQLMGGLHLILGISYWKLYCPKNIIINSISLTREQADFWNTTYTRGLGEFFYKNNIDFRGLISFPYSETESQSSSFPRKDRSLVSVGGGKDSLVTVELLKKSKKDIVSYVLKMGHAYPIIDDVISIAEIDEIQVRREIDPQLVELNKAEDTYNGHIPISAIYGWIGILLSVLYDFKYVISSNEKSASYENVEYLGETINHQWSKSIEYEKMFQKYVHAYLTPDITYFSYLRPLYEIGIVKEFIVYPKYFSHFSSCNRNFSSRKSMSKNKKWCGECPKCAFVFALMAAFLSKDTVLQIFGKNLFADQALVTTYKELLGVTGNKPFECVGTPGETAVAFLQAHEKGEYDQDVVMQMCETEILPKIDKIDALKKLVFTTSDQDTLPVEFRTI